MPAEWTQSVNYPNVLVRQRYEADEASLEWRSESMMSSVLQNAWGCDKTKPSQFPLGDY